jgi:predicted adenine nucleotide alpha hydrolase (AANH) superfamily ATPase
MNTPYSADQYVRPVLQAPNGADRILLHSCCAPCACEIMNAIKSSGIRQTVFFYNPNIHPVEEYELRKNENKRYCEKNDIAFIDADYDSDHWFQRVKGFENEPERGARCTLCFSMRFERTALFAAENDYSLISSTLGISRWKNLEQISRCGVQAASRYPDMVYWEINWRKQGGSSRMIEISKQESFYQQEYCGCVYSLRDTNRWRLSQGRPKIKRLIKFYGES